MFWKIIFRLYRGYVKVKCSFKIKYYKHLWKDQLSIDESLIFDETLSVNILSGDAKIRVGLSVQFRKYCSIIVSGEGKLYIGDNVFFNNYCSINCLSKISIGDDTIFGEGVRLYDHNHNFRKKNELIRNQGMRYSFISVGTNCWIGSNTIILPGVTVGNNVIIGANNLIYKSIPDNTVVKAKCEQLVQSTIYE